MTQAQFRRLAIVEAVVVAAIAAIFLISSAAGSDGQGRLTEEFHKVYPLSGTSEAYATLRQRAVMGKAVIEP